LWFELVISKILSSRSFHHHAFDLLLSNLKIRVKLPLSQKCLSALSIIKESLVTILASQISTQNISWTTLKILALSICWSCWALIAALTWSLSTLACKHNCCLCQQHQSLSLY
jgi:hypothetical protein